MYPVYGLKTFQTLANHFHLLYFKVAGVIPLLRQKLMRKSSTRISWSFAFDIGEIFLRKTRLWRRSICQESRLETRRSFHTTFCCKTRKGGAGCDFGFVEILKVAWECKLAVIPIAVTDNLETGMVVPVTWPQSQGLLTAKSARFPWEQLTIIILISRISPIPQPSYIS